ncbi:beta-aspartyl-peptidase [Dokdonella sp.]|uniref:beta-aspartyl-peptidase n=1 Tax=Dokdonella sp. TaxID=2291710 RepID=UPI0031C0EEF8|nr:beta-aspartyl-peptidase [Dokdonella sp.]
MSAPLLLRNARVYAPAPLGICHLLLAGGRIAWIGHAPFELPAALGATIIDLHGLRLIPGLIDGHVHVTGGGGEAGFRSRVPPLPLSRYTRAGITTVVGLLGTDDVARGTRELLAGVYALREEGLSAFGYVGGYHLPPATLTGSVRDDLTFVEALIGVGELAISDHRSSQPTLDELLRVAAQAHVAGLMTGKAGIVHLHLGDGVRGLDLVRQALDGSELPPRVFQPTHVNRRRALFEEALDLARRGCHIDITAFPVEEGEDAWTATDGLLRYLEQGAPAERVTISSDAGGSLPCFDGEGHMTHMDVGDSGALMATLRELLARGLALEDALPPFTANPARLLRLARKGRIEAGADADLVALDATGAVHHVIAGGELHVCEGRPVRRGLFETNDNREPGFDVSKQGR